MKKLNPSIVLATAIGLLALTQVPSMIRDLQFQQCRADLLDRYHTTWAKKWEERDYRINANRDLSVFCVGF